MKKKWTTGGTALLPAIGVGVFVLLILSGYQAPKAKDYDGTTAYPLKEQEAVAQETKNEKETETKQGSFDLEDGHYSGTGIGYGGNITVDVTIASKSITAIDIVSAKSETASFFERAKGVIDEIIKGQTTEVDTVSGATFSSRGIISAVKNALTGEVAEGTTAAASTGKGSTNVSDIKENAEYKDGTYTGSAQGFGGTIKVEVVIKKGKISKIKVIEAGGEGDSYLAKAKTLIQTMIKGQTTNVDTVSGATYSSAGLIKAVRNALSKAKVKKKSDPEKTTTEEEKETTSEENTTQVPEKEGTIPYEDGTYSGIGTGYQGEIKISLTIKNHTITSIVVTETSDDETFFNKAKAILTSVVQQQTANVDVVSGATYSSEGILEAIQTALENAKKATEKATENKTEQKEETTEDAAADSSEETTEDTTTDSSEETTEDAAGNDTVYKDGDYSVSVSCDPDEEYDFSSYTLQMDVTIKQDKITAISNIKGGDGYDSSNDFYVKRAANGTSKIAGVVSQITKSGTPDSIDVVSGATCTSKSIMEGCKIALEHAKK